MASQECVGNTVKSNPMSICETGQYLDDTVGRLCKVVAELDNRFFPNQGESPQEICPEPKMPDNVVARFNIEFAGTINDKILTLEKLLHSFE
jgi:hypothetical protein